MELYSNIPTELRELPHWILWKYEERNGKRTKVPKQLNGYNAKVNDSETWGTFQEVLERVSGFDGIGFVFTDTDYIGVDIDGKPDELEAFKQNRESKENIIGEFVNTLGSYAELSPSGRGIHVIGKGAKPGTDCRKDSVGVEMYDKTSSRFFTFTGNQISENDDIADISESIKSLYKKYLERKPVENVSTVRSVPTASIDDNKLIEKIRNSKQAQAFNMLYSGAWEGLYNSQSSADMALCNMLAYWTAKDEAQMDRIFRSSGLYRDKWNENRGSRTYGQITVETAIRDCMSTYEAPVDNYSVSVKQDEPGQPEETGKELPYIVEDVKTGRKKLIPGLLVDYIVDRYNAIYSTGRFYVYENGVYSICNNNEEKTLIYNLIPTVYRANSKLLDVRNLWTYAPGVSVDNERLNDKPELLNLKDGILNIKTGKLLEHSPKLLSTVQLNARHRGNSEGTRFKQLLDEIVPDIEVRTLLQEIMGYCLTDFNNAKKFFIIYGKGDSGKTVMLNLVQDLIGEKHISNIPLQKISDRFNIAELFGKRVNIYGDLPNTPITNGDLIKVLTGEDKATGERKGQDPFSFRNKAKLLFSCNDLPKNYGDRSIEFYNRLMIIPFNEVVPKEKQDPNLRAKLQLELDYIFKWCLEGLNRLMENGFKFSKCSISEELVERYKTESNSVLLFIEECCKVHEPKSKIYTARKVMFEAYDKYCQESGMKALNEVNFKAEMVKIQNINLKEQAMIKGTRARAYENVELVSELDFVHSGRELD